MNIFEMEYINLVKDLIDYGEKRVDRTGVGTRSLFGRQINIDLTEGFPALTTKKLYFDKVKSELLWFLEGSDDERRLAEIHYGKPRTDLVGKSTIWTANADKQGVDLGYTNTPTEKLLGPIYGVQWRDSMGVDQIVNLVESLKTDRNSRRHIVNAWNASEIEDMALPPCHTMFQMYVSNNNELSCHLYQRSCDIFLGAGFNYASYALLTHMLAQVCNYDVGDLIISYGDCHIYENHIEQAREMVSRTPYELPKLHLNCNIDDLDQFGMNDIELHDYEHHPVISAPMAV